MDIRTILLVLLFFVLLGWVVFCGVQFFRSGVKVVADGEFTGHIKCEICGTEYEVSAGEFTKSIMAKSVRTTKTRIQNGAFVNRPHYSYYAKKFSCPHCRKPTVWTGTEHQRASEKNAEAFYSGRGEVAGFYGCRRCAYLRRFLGSHACSKQSGKGKGRRDAAGEI